MEQLDAVHERKKDVRERLLRAVADGKITLARVEQLTGRGAKALGEWLAGVRLPPSTVLDVLEKELKKVER